MLVRRKILLEMIERGEMDVPLTNWADLLLEDDPEEYRDRPIPDAPTPFDPGSAAKIKVMRRRVALGQRPCHPGDLDLLHQEHLQRQAEKLNNGRRRLQPLEVRNGSSHVLSTPASAQPALGQANLRTA